jgi:hypothetical protein
MKKTLIIIPAVALGVFFALGRSVAQEPILFYDPIPVATDENHTRVEATHLKFFKAPKAPDGSINFVSDFVTIGGFEPGEGYKVFKNNLVATPGLLPKDQIPVNAFNRMIDDLGSRFQGSTITPIQGFCPESMRVAVLDNQGTVLDVIYFALDCQAHEEGNRTDHQLQVADIRNEFDSAELISLIGADPLVNPLNGNFSMPLNLDIKTLSPTELPILTGEW